MTGGLEPEWPDLPGPASFISTVIQDTLGCSGGVTSLWMPASRPPADILARIRSEMVDRGRSVVEVCASDGRATGSPTALLADRAGYRLSVRTVPGFLSDHRMSDCVFIVDDIDRAVWQSWKVFLRAAAAEATRTTRLRAPRILVRLPTWLPPSEFTSLIGRPPHRWLGVMSLTDTTLAAESLMGSRTNTVAVRTARAVVIEVAGWNRDVLRDMAAWCPADRIQPFDRLKALLDACPDAFPYPCWDNGLADEWDGDVHVHPLALLRHMGPEALLQRVWKGQVRALFPFLADIRLRILAKYGDILASMLPFTDRFGTTFNAVDELEIGQTRHLLNGRVTPSEQKLLRAAHEVRRALAHHEPAESSLVLELSDTWEHSKDGLQHPFVGWDWPRRDQTLAVMLGPAAGGKTTVAGNRFHPEDIISIDGMRAAMRKPGCPQPPEAAVQLEVRRLTTARLSAGQSAVIDGIGIRKDERISWARMAPKDMRVSYVVVDRPLARKLDGSESRAPFICSQDAAFGAVMPEMLQGDGLPNVVVTLIEEKEHESQAS